MTVRELVNQLLDIIEKEPHKEDVDVYVFMCDETYTANISDDFESPIPIEIVDSTISDRVDINI